MTMVSDEKGNERYELRKRKLTVMNFFGRGSNTPPPSSAPYSRVPEQGSGYNTPTGYNTPRVHRQQPLGGYNDPNTALFEKRPMERRPPPRAGNMFVLSN